MQLDSAEMTADKTRTRGNPPQFTISKIDRRTRQAKLAHLALAGFIEDVGDITGLTRSELLAIEEAALEVARTRTLQERFMAGKAASDDVAAAAHLARKGRSLVARIAKRMGTKRRLGR
jgi:hypothetical protein